MCTNRADDTAVDILNSVTEDGVYRALLVLRNHIGMGF